MGTIHPRHLVQIHRHWVQPQLITALATRRDREFLVYGLLRQDRFERPCDRTRVLRGVYADSSLVIVFIPHSKQTKTINAPTERVISMATFLKCILAGWCVLISSPHICTTKKIHSRLRKGLHGHSSGPSMLKGGTTLGIRVWRQRYHF